LSLRSEPVTSGTTIARQTAKPGTEEMFPSKITHVHSPVYFGLDFLRALAIAAVVVARGFGFLMPHLPWWCGFLGRSTISMPGMVAAGWALLYRYYESRCTHLRERVAPAVARLLRRT